MNKGHRDMPIAGAGVERQRKRENSSQKQKGNLLVDVMTWMWTKAVHEYVIPCDAQADTGVGPSGISAGQRQDRAERGKNNRKATLRSIPLFPSDSYR